MIGYTMLGTNNLDRAAKYYDELFKSIGISRVMEVDNYFVAWAPTPDDPGFTVTIPYNKEAATVGNGVMIALTMDSKEQLRSFHAKALELGGTTEGEPGFRGESGEFQGEDAESGFYGAYFRDLDGNKLGLFHIVKEEA
jgi:catechol 2,3-dioxygenase-like lactoylglutathione lyase family enzyme